MKFKHRIPCPLCGDTQELESDYPDTHITSELCPDCKRIWEMGKRADALSPKEEYGLILPDDAKYIRAWNDCLREIKGK